MDAVERAAVNRIMERAGLLSFVGCAGSLGLYAARIQQAELDKHGPAGADKPERRWDGYKYRTIRAGA